jgi:hypothetical protein
MRSKKINRPTWKGLSLSRKDKLKEEEAARPSAATLFRSPSVYDEKDTSGHQTVMSSYLSGKICPLTPSQQPTDVAHLAQKPREDPKSPGHHEDSTGARRQLQMELQRKLTSPKSEDEDEGALVPADYFLRQAEQREHRSTCVLM